MIMRFAVVLGILGFCGISFAQCTGIPSANTVCAGPASGGAGEFSGRKLVPGDLAGIPGQYTVQNFSSGTGTYVPTSAAVTWIKVSMVGGGGGGGGASVGTAGGATSFGAWIAPGGNPGGPPSSNFGGGAGQIAGAATVGPGILVSQQAIGGISGMTNSSATVIASPSPGLSTPMAPSGIGGNGGPAAGASTGSGASGSSGRYVVFLMTAAQVGTGVSYQIGAAGTGGSSNAFVALGGGAGAGAIHVEEYYTPAQP